MSEFSNDPDRTTAGQKQWTLIVEGQAIGSNKVIIAIAHTWAFNSVEVFTNIDEATLLKFGMRNYRPIALFTGHHYDVLPADFTRPLPLPEQPYAP